MQPMRKKAPYSQAKRSPEAKETNPKIWHPRDNKRKKDSYSRVKESPEATETALRNLVVSIRGTLGILYVHLYRFTCTENNKSQKQNKTFRNFEKTIPFSVWGKDNRPLWYFFSLITFFLEIWCKNDSFCRHVCLHLCILHDMFMWFIDYRFGFWSSPSLSTCCLSPSSSFQVVKVLVFFRKI